MLPSVVVAQVPTMDDYNLGSGSVVQPVKGASSNIVRPQETFPAFQSTTIRDVPSYLTKAVSRLEKYVSEGRWEEVVSLCRTLDSSALRAKGFGIDTAGDLGYLLSASDGKRLENLREELRFAAEQLRDEAVSRRVFFFNRDDLAAVQRLRVGDAEDAIDAAPAAETASVEDEGVPVQLVRDMAQLAAQVTSLLAT